MLNIGDCFTLHSHGKPHLHIVIQDERPGDRDCRVICVYLSSVGNKTIIDERTILVPGQHKFITERSFVKYRNVLVESKTVLTPKIIKSFDPIHNNILLNIQYQFTTPGSYKNIPKGIIQLYNQWREDHMYSHPDF